LAERIGTIKARGRKPGKQKAGKHRVTESTEPGRQEVGKHKARKHSVQETQSHREHREKNRDGGGMFGRLPILQRLARDGFGCYRISEVASEEKGVNPSET
jgi:hypothetical protein